MPEDRWPLHSYLVYINAIRTRVYRKKRTYKRFLCTLYGVAAVSSLSTTLNMCQLAFLYIAAHYFVWGWGKHIILIMFLFMLV